MKDRFWHRLPAGKVLPATVIYQQRQYVALPIEKNSMSNPFLEEVARRRTFAIISHPDAGKTTITEKCCCSDRLSRPPVR